MYPFVRTALTVAREARKPKVAVTDTHHLALRCLPWDLDTFAEMNNGRILTLYDLGRTALAVRTGLVAVLRRERWGLVVAGSTIRYRARVTAFQAVDLRSRILGWDARFIYVEQAMWRGATCCNHALLRTGVTENGRLIDAARVATALQIDPVSPVLPDWVTAWIAADATRPWPPRT